MHGVAKISPQAALRWHEVRGRLSWWTSHLKAVLCEVARKRRSGIATGMTSPTRRETPAS
jgi:hypothetical protein